MRGSVRASKSPWPESVIRVRLNLARAPQGFIGGPRPVVARFVRGDRARRVSPAIPRYHTISTTMNKPGARRAIQVISHGPNCLDGVMAAAAVARFYAGQRVKTRLVANGDSDSVLQDLELRSGGEDDEVWITDLSWNSTATGEHLTDLA